MNVALIVLGGEGKRMGLTVPKQFLLHNNIPLFIYTIKKFNNHPMVDEIILVTNKDYLSFTKDEVNKYHLKKVKNIVIGGNTRMDSVMNGLSLINDDDIVLIHDAVRPFVSEKIITDNINECLKTGAVVTAIKETSTISSSDDGMSIKAPLDRNKTYIHQTPQTFKAKIIKKSYQTIKNKEFTDDATLVHELGYKVSFVDGENTNIKITKKEDLLFLSNLL